ncbi:MAG: tRNA dihydrouridine synthase DusB [Bacteroidales bacterium]|nr:tRNA dihydrouridine synthase DusB [Porphyromonas sp.]MDD6934237.1 tRNA dihydrouridine synthase DusB [Bacteroidales bacterium]
MLIAGQELGPQPLLLAPMEDVSDSAFRLLCRSFGASMVYSEFISADALIRSVRGACNKLFIHPDERPAVIQIYGRNVDSMAEAATIASAAGPEILDLNFGCPVKRVAGKGAGSGMLRDIPLLLEITRAVVQASQVPVTVKTRLGWDHQNIVIEDLAEALQDCGIAALTIHGRTRSDMYTGQANWEMIGRVKNNPRITIPIIGNGDITTPQGAKEAFDKYGVDAVMVGRGSIGRPWVFEEMRYYLDTGEVLPERPASERLDVLIQMIHNNIHKLDERRGILHSRRHLAASPIFKGIANFRPWRIAMLQATTMEQLLSVLQEIRPMLVE